MATQKPISTISYNTELFLKEKLDNWVNSHAIQSYMYIVHKGEDGDKDHIHLRIEPNKKLDPMTLTEDLKEYKMGDSKPLGCRPWRPSKEEDWILYAVHDKQYLNMKYGGGERGEKLPYKWEDIKAPDNYDVEIAFIRAKSYMEHTSVNMATKIRDGVNPLSLVLQGENPYMVNAIIRTVAQNDYTRLQNDFNIINQRYMSLAKAVDELGYIIEIDENGELKLTKE